jgi:hypothetical protein
MDELSARPSGKSSAAVHLSEGYRQAFVEVHESPVRVVAHIKNADSYKNEARRMAKPMHHRPDTGH